MYIEREFEKIAGFRLLPRRTNLINENIERKDNTFAHLTNLYFSDRRRFKKLQNKIEQWVKKNKSETITTLAGYIYYIDEDFQISQKYFLKAIAINPDNLDNWVDLAFTIRHIGDTRTSEEILFNLGYVMHYYRLLKLNTGNYKHLLKLIRMVSKNAS